VVVRAKELVPELDVSRLITAGMPRLTSPLVLALRLRLWAPPTFIPLAILMAPEPELRFSVPLLARFMELPLRTMTPEPAAASVTDVVLVVSPTLPSKVMLPADPPACRVIVAPSRLTPLLVTMLLVLISENVPVALLVAASTNTAPEPLLLVTKTLPGEVVPALKLRVNAAVEMALVLVPMLPEDVPALRVTMVAERVPTPVLSVIEPAFEPPVALRVIVAPGAVAVTLPWMSMF